MPISFISSKYSDETRSMHTRSDNIDWVMMGNETDEMTEEIFNNI